MVSNGVYGIFIVLIQLAGSLTSIPSKNPENQAENRSKLQLVTFPSVLDSDGKFISHVVIKQQRKSRLEEEQNDDKRETSKEGLLHLEVPAFDGKKLRLRLSKNTQFTAPGLVIEKEGHVRHHNPNCHYEGHIIDQPDSAVSLSYCQGLKGFIHTEEGDHFLIEPVEGKSSSNAVDQHPHVLYKSSVDDFVLPKKQNGKFCSNQAPIKRQLRSPYLDSKSGQKRRSRRSVSTEKNVEMLMVADQTMYQFYKDGLEEYLLTIANMVSNIFRDPSIGTAINIVLVRMMILKENPSSLKVTHHAGHTLKHFCRWASLINPRSEGHPNHHDIAVLITRHDICKGINEPCETLGLSQVNGLCTKDKSCNVNEDSGLTLAYTIAHEIGHKYTLTVNYVNITFNTHLIEERKIFVAPNSNRIYVPHQILVGCDKPFHYRDNLAGNVAEGGKHDFKEPTEPMRHLFYRKRNRVTRNKPRTRPTDANWSRNFGMLHDGNENDCKWTHDKPFLMSPQLDASGRAQLWSSCSRNYVRRFLNKGWGLCLNDQPANHDFKFPTMLPGVIYDADHQCRLQYGPTSSHCTGMTDICNRLWCRVGRACHSKLEPAADGTKCGDIKWCYKGGCIERGMIPDSVDGGWGPWKNHSECSRTCGGGVSFTERHCDNPRPAHGGKYCIGEWKKYQLCNTQPCPEGSVGFRELQCSRFDNKRVNHRQWKWKPRYSQVTPCELHCTPKGLFGLYFSKKLADQVHDGTLCAPGKRDVCINGKCEHVGCDNVLHSSAKEDKCGVCRGNGTACETVKSTFDQKTGYGYVETKVIPAGARNIRVEEVASASNYLALRSSSGKWYLNGDWYIQQSGEYTAGGTTVYYKRRHNKETFEAVGPTSDELHIMLLFQTKNPGLKFEYTIPKNQTITHKLVFSWKYRDWTTCSATCGIGTRRAEVECTEESGTPVDDKYCKPLPRPDDKQKTCNENPCPPTWWKGQWQKCSKTCGKGISIRSVLCVRSSGNDEQVALKDEACAVIMKKPSVVRSCVKKPCPLAWTVGHWSKCSVSCGQGIKKRKVACGAGNSNEECDVKAVPISWSYCNKGQCPKITVPPKTTARISSPFEEVRKKKRCTGLDCQKWTVSAWSKCSVTCGQGSQVRRVYCAGSQLLCDKKRQPFGHRKCTMVPCTKWQVGSWSKCSASCGVGTRKRIVKCFEVNTGFASKDCPVANKPRHYEKCSTKTCPTKSTGKSRRQGKKTQELSKNCFESGRDTYFCKLVVLHKFCQFKHWKDRCCKTCLSSAL